MFDVPVTFCMFSCCFTYIFCLNNIYVAHACESVIRDLVHAAVQPWSLGSYFPNGGPRSCSHRTAGEIKCATSPPPQARALDRNPRRRRARAVVVLVDDHQPLIHPFGRIACICACKHPSKPLVPLYYVKVRQEHRKLAESDGAEVLQSGMESNSLN